MAMFPLDLVEQCIFTCSGIRSNTINNYTFTRNSVYATDLGAGGALDSTLIMTNVTFTSNCLNGQRKLLGGTLCFFTLALLT